MKKLICIILLLISYSALSQSLSVFDINTDDFPIVKAKFWAFDENGEQITDLTPEDFQITENGVEREVLSVACPPPQPPQAISSVLTIDVSGSMQGQNIEYAKAAATAWVEGLPLGKSKCALTTFNSGNYFNQDFTSDKNKLITAINGLQAGGGTNFNAGFINTKSGALLAAQNGKYKKVVVFLTDGHASGSETAIIQKAKQINATIFCITLGMKCPPILRNISEQTGGLWYENVTTKEQAEQVYREILQNSQGGDPCEIEWESGLFCTAGITNVELAMPQNGTKSNLSYHSPNTSVANLEFEPSYVKFADPQVGIRVEEIVTVTARNADFSVTNITSINAAFEISPKSFSLNEGQSIELTVSYIPPDSGYVYSRFDFESLPCITKYYASGGWRGELPSVRTIKLIHPNGGEVFVAGSDTVITWDGVPPEEPVRIEYRIDDDQPWVMVSDSATGFNHPFKVPRVVSKNYLARITAKSTDQGCYNPDFELCGKIWMGCNLDVEHYRNGDSIPHVTDPIEWVNLRTGAWCYYDNDPANGEIYGKLYNWYAVNDPRGLAPEGWHVPTDDEWIELEMCLGMSQKNANETRWRGTNEGSKLAGDYDLWPDGILRNNSDFGSSGFNARPGGHRDDITGISFDKGAYGYWWTSSEYSSDHAMERILRLVSSNIWRNYYYKRNGYSVRCVKD
jgi:VWFA-related protein